MLVLSTDSALCLLDPQDIEQGRLPSHVDIYRAQLEDVLSWARTYLCRSHTALGREGPVCPFAQLSLDRALFWLTVYPGAHPRPEDVHTVVKSFRDWFLNLAPREGTEAQYKAILVLFPELAPGLVPEVIEGVQSTLKPEFVAHGLMIGQFHAECKEPGVRNPDFRPLRSPVPLLAIRHMVHTDALFLSHDGRSLAAYLRRFGQHVPARLQPAVREAALAFGLEYPASGLVHDQG